jgi:transmembrane sensor
MDEILVKYLLNEASDEERSLVQDWLNLREENRKYFEQFKHIWNQSKLLAEHSKVDENAAWERFRQRIEPGQPAQTIEFKPKRFQVSLKAAATITLLILGSWMVYFLVGLGNELVVLNAGDQVMASTLPDGSVITLNKNASLSYPEHFKGNKRPVQLKGEAFFDVSPDKSKPFEIAVDDVTVAVVGTSFNIKSTNEETEIVVETGMVTVAKKGHKVTLKPGQKAIVRKASDKPEVQLNRDDLYNYYRTHEFVCNNTPLFKLVEALNSAFDTEIIIENPAIRELPLTTTFREDSLNNILSTVVATFNIAIEQREGKIVLK